MTVSLDDIEAVVWDFDGVHYSFYACPGLDDLCAQTAMDVAMAALPDLEQAKALELKHRSYREYGSSFQAYIEWVRTNGGDARSVQDIIFRDYHRLIFNRLVHHYPKQFGPNPETIAAFETSAPRVKHALATHSCVDEYAGPALERLQLLRFFNPAALHDLKHVNFATKSKSTAMVELALRSLNTPARRAAFVEDSLSNLERAKDIDSRLTTVYMHHGKPLGTLPSYVNLQMRNPATLMRLFVP